MINSLKRIRTKWSLRRQGVIVGTQCTLAGVQFRGAAKIESYCRFIGEPNIDVGENFYANVGCHLLGDICIGADVLIGPKAVVWGRDHGTCLGELIRTQPHTHAPIVIGNDCWIGANATILKGVHLSDGVIVGAGAVVTKSFPPNAIVVGNPARILRFREM